MKNAPKFMLLLKSICHLRFNPQLIPNKYKTSIKITMCELLAISSQLATHTGFSLKKLASHSYYDNQQKISNPDGWGVAYYEDNDVTLLREPQAASESKLVRFIEKNIQPTKLLISHIRKATDGTLALKNTHPFRRELGGCMHVFAHNGDAKGIQQNPQFKTQRFQPLGDTDSEHAFCHLLDQLAALWKNSKNGQLPALSARHEIVCEFAEKLSKLGPANFLYADSDVLFAHADKRTQEDGIIKPPGLYRLTRRCNRETQQSLVRNGVTLTRTRAKTDSKEALQQQVTILASVPLTEEEWLPVQQGEVLIVANGKIIA